MPPVQLLAYGLDTITLSAEFELPHAADNLGLVAPDVGHLFAELDIEFDVDAAVAVNEAANLFPVEDGDVADETDEVAVQVGRGMLDFPGGVGDALDLDNMAD
jgi:hypothetical protein